MKSDKELVTAWQEAMRPMPMSGFIGYSTAHAIFKDKWPEGSYFDFEMNAYYIEASHGSH